MTACGSLVFDPRRVRGGVAARTEDLEVEQHCAVGGAHCSREDGAKRGEASTKQRLLRARTVPRHRVVLLCRAMAAVLPFSSAMSSQAEAVEHRRRR